MKQTFLILLLNLTIISGFSQDFSGGIILGVCGSQVDGDQQSKYKKPGLILGAFVSMPFSERSALKIETYYVGKGAVLNEEQADGYVLTIFNTSFHYIEMPFLYNLKLHPKFDIALGIAPSYLIAHKLTGIYVSIDENLYSMKNFDFQPMGQIDFYLTDKISSSLRYSYSMFDIRKDPMVEWYNNNLSIVFRYKIK